MLNTTELIAEHINKSFVLPLGVQNSLRQTVNNSRIEVQNFTGQSIDQNDIEEKFQSVITNLSKAQAIRESFAWAATVSTSGGAVIVTSGATYADNVKLDDLSVQSVADAETKALNYLSTLSKDYPNMLEQKANKELNSLGRGHDFVRSIS